MLSIFLHTYHLRATTRQQFKRDAPCTSKKIEGRQAIEIKIAIEHIEDIFFGKIGSGPCLERVRHIEMPSFILSCYDAHESKSIKSSYI